MSSKYAGFKTLEIARAYMGRYPWSPSKTMPPSQPAPREGMSAQRMLPCNQWLISSWTFRS